YTFDGPYFWTGKGFGMSLAETDGFVVGLESGGPVLRSPHNIHMSYLGRTGVPGLVMWGVLVVAWYLTILLTIMRAKARGDREWAYVMIWAACYVGAIIVNSTFDVAIEGPMQGIVFWVMMGLGLATAMLYRIEVMEAGQRPARSPFDPEIDFKRPPEEPASFEASAPTRGGNPASRNTTHLPQTEGAG
ncbi:MAG: hypothetical protein AAGG72_09160, partial [Pseudomonadota bacterium]